MAVSQIITDSFIKDSIVHAVKNVCSTMLRQDACYSELTRVPVDAVDQDQSQIIGCVGFVGEIDGVVHLCLPEKFARYAASHILGMTDTELDSKEQDIIRDVIGEITNMTVGGFKNALCEIGYPCKLTLPTIVRGHHLTVAALKSAERHVFHFTCAGHHFVADIQLKIE